MFASIRRYRLNSGDMRELARRVDTDFAEQLSGRPGFVSYEFVEGGDGQLATVSMFRDAEGAAESRDLARQWTEQELGDLDFTRQEGFEGEVHVSRAARDMLEPGHVEDGHGYMGIRIYRADAGAMPEMMHIADTEFADRVAMVDGFDAYHVIDCGDGRLVAMTMVRDRATVEECDALSREFVRDKLAEFQIERVETITGMVLVSRAVAEVLEPAHA
jgi:hypothetical protein